MIHEQTKKYSWDALEYEHQEKSVDWYWALGIIIVIGVVLCILAKNYLFGVLLAIGGIMLGYYGNDKPISTRVELSDRGIKIDNNLYTHETIECFWMYTDHKQRNCLTIMTGRKVLPQITVTLSENISAQELREYLIKFIPEKELKPSLITMFAESFGL